MWTPLRQALEKTKKEFNLEDQVKPVGLNEWHNIEEKIYNTFCSITNHGSRPVWIWERLKVENLGIRVEKQPHVLLDRLIDQQAELFLLLNETVREKDKFWIYESKIDAIQTIVAETIGIDEVTIVDKKFSWIVCINHHDAIIVGGQQMVGKLKKLQNEITLG